MGDPFEGMKKAGNDASKSQQQNTQQNTQETVKVRITYADRSAGPDEKGNYPRRQIVFNRLQRNSDRNDYKLVEGFADKAKFTKEKGSPRYATSEEALVMSELNKQRGLNLPTQSKDSSLIDPEGKHPACRNTKIAKVCEEDTENQEPVSVYTWDWGALSEDKRDELIENLREHAYDDEVIVDESLDNKEEDPDYIMNPKTKTGINNAKRDIDSIYNELSSKDPAFKATTDNTRKLASGDDPVCTKVDRNSDSSPSYKKTEFKSKRDLIEESPIILRREADNEADKFAKTLSKLDAGKANPNVVKKIRNSIRAAFDEVDCFSSAKKIAKIRHSEQAQQDLGKHLRHEAETDVNNNFAMSSLENFVTNKPSAENSESQPSNRLERSGQAPYKANKTNQPHDLTKLPTLPSIERPRYSAGIDRLFKVYDPIRKNVSGLKDLGLAPFEFLGRGARKLSGNRLSGTWWNNLFHTDNGPVTRLGKKTGIHEPAWVKKERGRPGTSQRFDDNMPDASYDSAGHKPADYEKLVKSYHQNILDSIRNGATWDDANEKQRSFLNTWNKIRGRNAGAFSSFSNVDKVIKHYKNDDSFWGPDDTEGFGRKQRLEGRIAGYILTKEGYPPPNSVCHVDDVELPDFISNKVDTIYDQLINKGRDVYDEDEGGVRTEDDLLDTFKYRIKKKDIEAWREHTEDSDAREAIRNELKLQYRQQVQEAEAFYKQKKQAFITDAQQAIQDAKAQKAKQAQVDYVGVDVYGKLQNKSMILDHDKFADDEQNLKNQLEKTFHEKVKLDLQQSTQKLAELRNKNADINLDAEAKNQKNGNSKIKNNYVSQNDALYKYLNLAEEDFILREALEDEYNQVRNHENFKGLDAAPNEFSIFAEDYDRGDALSPSDANARNKIYQELKDKAEKEGPDSEWQRALDYLQGNKDNNQPGINGYKRMLANSQLQLTQNEQYKQQMMGQHIYNIKENARKSADGGYDSAEYGLFQKNWGLAEAEQKREQIDQHIQELTNNPEILLQLLSVLMDIMMAVETGTSRMERRNATMSPVNKAQLLSTAHDFFDDMMISDMMKCVIHDKNTGEYYVDMGLLDSAEGDTNTYELASNDQIPKTNIVTKKACYAAIAGLALGHGLKVHHNPSGDKRNEEELEKQAKDMQKYYEQRKPWHIKQLKEEVEDEKADERNRKRGPESELTHEESPSKSPALEDKKPSAPAVDDSSPDKTPEPAGQIPGIGRGNSN